MIKDKNIDWNEMSNSEIESKIKSLEFEHEKIMNDIDELYNKSNYIKLNYSKGKKLIEKRLTPKKFK